MRFPTLATFLLGASSVVSLAVEDGSYLDNPDEFAARHIKRAQDGTDAKDGSTSSANKATQAALQMANGVKLVCSHLEKIKSCSFNVPVPMPKVEYEEKTLEIVTINCPDFPDDLGALNGTKWLLQQCEPDEKEFTMKWPSKLSANSKNVAVCDMIRVVLGPKLLEKVGEPNVLCECLPQAADILVDPDFQEAISTGSLGGVTGDILKKAYDLTVCIIKHTSGGLHNNLEELKTTGVLATNNQTLVFTAEPITVKTAIDISAALSTCVTGVACDIRAIVDVMTEYLEATGKGIVTQAQREFVPWLEGLLTIKNKFGDLKNGTGNARANLQAIKTNGAIISKFQGDMKQQVQLTLQVGENLWAATDVILNTVPKLEQMHAVISKALELFEDFQNTNVEMIVEEMSKANMTKAQDIASTFQAARTIPDIVRYLGGNFTEMKTIVTNLTITGPKFVQGVNDIIGDKYSNLPAGAELGDASKKAVEEVIDKVQDEFNTLVEGAMPVINTILYLSGLFGEAVTNLDFATMGDIAANAADQALSAANSTVLNSTLKCDYADIDIDVSVATYKVWTEDAFKIPCVELAEMVIDVPLVDDLDVSIDYPRFWDCDQKVQLRLPNEYIPAVTIKLPSCHPLLLIRAGFTHQVRSLSWERKPGSRKRSLVTRTEHVVVPGLYTPPRVVSPVRVVRSIASRADDDTASDDTSGGKKTVSYHWDFLGEDHFCRGWDQVWDWLRAKIDEITKKVKAKFGDDDDDDNDDDNDNDKRWSALPPGAVVVAARGAAANPWSRAMVVRQDPAQPSTPSEYSPLGNIEDGSTLKENDWQPVPAVDMPPMPEGTGAPVAFQTHDFKAWTESGRTSGGSGSGSGSGSGGGGNGNPAQKVPTYAWGIVGGCGALVMIGAAVLVVLRARKRKEAKYEVLDDQDVVFDAQEQEQRKTVDPFDEAQIPLYDMRRSMS